MFIEYNSSYENDLKLMIKEFYSLPAVLHKIPDSHIESTINILNAKSQLAKAYLIFADDKIAGYGLLAFTYSNEAGGTVIWLEELYIRSEFQNRSLGGRFIDFIIDEYKNKVKRIRLEYTSDNKAQSLYKAKGFEQLDYKQMLIDF